MFNFVRFQSRRFVANAARFKRSFSSVEEDAPTKMELFVKNLPLVGVCIGSIALTFQLAVLYPWHDELSLQFDDLQRVVVRLEETSTALEQKMQAIVAMENEVKVKERRILTISDDIISAEHNIAQKLDMVKGNLEK